MIRCLLLVPILALLLTAAAPADKPPPPPDGVAKNAPAFEMSAAEKELLQLTNKERAQVKAPLLKPNPTLFKIARAHAANMARQGKLEHKLDGKTVIDRAKAANYDYKKIGENIAWTDGDTLKVIVKKWMESPRHRENMLNKRYVEIGFGVARDAKGEIYFAQVLGVQRRPR